MKTTRTFGALAAALALGSSAYAGAFGTNITIPDLHTTNNAWEGNYEDQETEPRTIHNQSWDLEGMFLDGTKLTLVGGYDFKNGVNYGGKNYGAGDLFIDTTGDAKFGSAANGGSGTGGTVTDRFGYDYVFDLDFVSMTFDVIALGAGTVTSRGSDIAASNPWRYVSGGTAVAGFQDIGFTYLSGLTDAGTGFVGGTHYAISLDVSFLSGQDAIFHNTMSCGNDNLMGRAHVPDAAATLSLFGAALLGLVGIRRFTAKA